MVIQVRSSSYPLPSRTVSGRSVSGRSVTKAVDRADDITVPLVEPQPSQPAPQPANPSPTASPTNKRRTGRIPPQPPGTYYDEIVGAVVFDWNGLPQEYFVIPESELLPWEQTVFQMLGLRWLLMSYLELGGFYHAKVSCPGYSAFVVRQREYYMALLLERSEIRDSNPAFMEWLQSFDVSYLRSDPRFQHH